MTTGVTGKLSTPTFNTGNLGVPKLPGEALQGPASSNKACSIGADSNGLSLGNKSTTLGLPECSTKQAKGPGGGGGSRSAEDEGIKELNDKLDGDQEMG